MPPSIEQIKHWLRSPAPISDLRQQIREAAITPRMLELMRKNVPDASNIPMLTYSKYREFEHTGERPGYQNSYFLRRAMLTRAMVEYIMGDQSMRSRIAESLWAMCEEARWVVPGHEEQGPIYWNIEPLIVRTTPLGAHTSLTREPDSIDLFAAEAGAIVAGAGYLVGEDIAPEVRQRARQEVERHFF